MAVDLSGGERAGTDSGPLMTVGVKGYKEYIKNIEYLEEPTT
jgi:hypothetical protein